MDGFTFYKSYWETAQAIPDADARLQFLEACMRYTLDDIAPEGLSPIAAVAFTAIRPMLEKSKAKSGNHKSKEDKQTTLLSDSENQIESNEIKQNQTESNEIKSDTDTVTDTVTVTEIKNNVRRAAAPVSTAQLEEEFKTLWERYPKDRRRGKKRAYNAYVSARTRAKNPVEYADVLLGLNRYLGHIAARRIESDFILQAETFFFQERWTDEYDNSGGSAPLSKYEQGVYRNDYSDVDFETMAAAASG